MILVVALFCIIYLAILLNVSLLFFDLWEVLFHAQLKS